LVPRLTLTPSFLCKAEATLILATGESKADIIPAVLADDSQHYPISKTLSVSGENYLVGDAQSLKNVK